jgi:hypothetical protein
VAPAAPAAVAARPPVAVARPAPRREDAPTRTAAAKVAAAPSKDLDLFNSPD